jgi:integrator complex subunit 3
MELLANLQFLQPRLGSSLLLFLTSSPESEISQEDKISLYSEFCQAMGTDCSLGDWLVRDLTQCQDDDVDLFLHLIPHLYHLLPEATLGNVPLLYLIVSCVDGSQIMTLVTKIVSQQLILLNGNTCQIIMEASLTWETFEQYAFWHIYNAHELPIKLIQNFLPKLSAKTDAEALTNVMFILKKKVPTVEILSKCLTREPAGDDFLSSLCCFWMKYCPKVLPGIVAALVTKCLGLEGGRKRKADPRLQEKPIILQLLGHFTPFFFSFSETKTLLITNSIFTSSCVSRRSCCCSKMI